MYIGNIAGSQAGSKLPTPTFYFTGDDEDLAEIDRAAAEVDSCESEMSSPNSKPSPQVNRDDSQNYKTTE